MPVYNAENYVSEAIDSILNQTYSDFEFLIFDDGSTDRTPDILKYYSDKDSRVIVETLNHQGYSPLLNIGINKAKGCYIARMDSDDVSLPDRFYKQVSFLEGHPKHVAVGCQAVRIDPDGDPLGPMEFAIDHDDIDMSQVYNAKGLILHPGSMICRDALLEIGGYRPEFEPGEDFDLFLRLAEVGKLANLPDTLIKYRSHLKNVTVTKKLKHQNVKQKALDEAFERRKIAVDVPEIKLNDIPISESENHFIWMHTAIHSGYYRTAKKHALLGLRKSDKRRRDYYNYFQGILGPITFRLKKWMRK